MYATAFLLLLSALRDSFRGRATLQLELYALRRDSASRYVIAIDERHLRRILASYFDYCHRLRTHLSLCKDSPVPRPVGSAKAGEVIALPQVGGLHHRYERLAA